MAFDWISVVRRYGDDLHGIVRALAALLRPGETMLPRRLHARILATLRPAEFAARRLIAMAARVLDLAVPPARARTSQPRQAAATPAETGANPAPRRPHFRLFDPPKAYGDPFLSAEDEAALWAWTAGADASPDTQVDAAGLRRRIEALVDAVEDVEGHALRLARWRARRIAAKAAGLPPASVRPACWSPMRPGRPPGWKRNPGPGIDTLLKDLHACARDAWDGALQWPDTS